MAAFISHLKIGMKIIMEYTQQTNLLCVAQMSELYMKVKLKYPLLFWLLCLRQKNVIKHSPLGKHVGNSTSWPLLLSDLLCRDASVDSPHL